MKTNVAMGLSGLVAIALDYVVVASIVGVLLLTRWLGVGWMLDVLTAFLISSVIVAWFYGKRLSAFLNRQDDQRSNSVVVSDPVRHTSIKSAKSRGSDFRRAI